MPNLHKAITEAWAQPPRASILHPTRLFKAQDGEPRMLPLNINGDPEYATVVMTVDRMHDDAGDHVDRSKMMSTRTPEDMLRGLAAYYGDQALLKECSSLIDECADIDVIYAYRPARK